MKRRGLIGGLAIVGLTLGAIALYEAARSGTEIDTTVCQLGIHGAEFDGKYVHLNAIYLTDLQHFTFFKDPACPNITIDEDELRGMHTNHSLKRFNEAVWSVSAGDQRVFAVNISGEFRWQKNWKPPALLSGVMEPGPHGMLIVDKVLSFKRVIGDWKKAR